MMMEESSSSSSHNNKANRKSDRTYVDYLQDVAGESYEEELGGLNTSGTSIKDTPSSHQNRFHLAIPTDHNDPETPRHQIPSGMVSPQLTEARSFVNGLLSPFSPLLKNHEQRQEFLQYVSLQPCRKVSVVVRVLPCDDPDKRCLFPHLKNAPDPQQLPSHATPLIRRPPKTPRDMVVVNPSAFGKFIPTEVTMETARLVAQVAHISSEDWARLYQFHHVMWPEGDHSHHNHNHNNINDHHGGQQGPFSTMDTISLAVAQDALSEQQSSMLISMGQAPSCIGTDGSALRKIIAHCRAILAMDAEGGVQGNNSNPGTVGTLSMVEIHGAKEHFRDVLYQQHKQNSVNGNENNSNNSNNRHHHVTLRHVDMKGAKLEGLTEVPIHDESIQISLESYFSRRLRRSTRQSVDTTIIAWISFWESSEAQEQGQDPFSQITCVEMSTSPSDKHNSNHYTHNQKVGNVTKQNRNVSLGLALRQLLLHNSSPKSAEPALSYRETTLTKVLQRSLESSKVVLLASVSQRSEDYDTTLFTLDYLRRLLVKPGKTAASPFTSNAFFDNALGDGGESVFGREEASTVTSATSTTPSKLQQYANDGYLLEKILSDPRQRLAKIFKMSPSPSTTGKKQSQQELETVPSNDEDYYHPVDYMEGLETSTASPKPYQSPPVTVENQPAEVSMSQMDPLRILDTMEPRETIEREHWSPVEPTYDDLNDDIQENLHLDENNSDYYDQGEDDDSLHDKEISEEEFSMQQQFQDQTDEFPHHIEDWHVEDPVTTVGVHSDDYMDGSSGSHVHQTWTPEDELVELAHKDISGGPVEEEIIFEPEQYDENDNDEFDLPNQPMSSAEEPSTIEESPSLPPAASISQEVEDNANTSWLEWQPSGNGQSDEYDDDDDVLEPQTQYDLPELSGSQYNESHIESNVNISVISKNESYQYLRHDSSVIHSTSGNEVNGKSPAHGIRLDNESRQRSAFESIHTPTIRKNQGETSRSSPSEEFNGELRVLEGAVHQIQHLQDDLWQASSQSLQKLKTSLHSQRLSMARLSNENEDLQSTVANLKDEIQRNSEDHDNEIQRYEDEVQQVQQQLHITLSDKDNLARDLAETKTVYKDLENRLQTLERELRTSQEKVTSTNEAYNSVRQSRDEFESQIAALRTRLEKVEREKTVAENACGGLKNSLEKSEEQKHLLERELRSNQSTIHELTHKLGMYESDRKELEEKTKRLQSSKSQDQVELDDLRDKARRMGVSLESAEKRRALLEEEQEKDRIQIQRLEIELRDAKESSHRQLEDQRRIERQFHDAEHNLKTAGEQVAKREEMIQRLTAECEKLQQERSQDGSSKIYWEEQSRKLSRTIDDINDERKRLADVQRDNEVYIKKLEEQLRQGQTVKGEIAHLQEEVRRLKGEKVELESALSREKAVHFEETKRSAAELSKMKGWAEEFKCKIQTMQDREKELGSKKDSEISELRAKLQETRRAFESSTDQLSDFRSKLNAAEGRESLLRKQVEESNKTVERYRQEMTQLHEELALGRQREMDQISNIDFETQRLNGRIHTLENELARISQERDDALKMYQADSQVSRSLGVELRSAKEELSRQKADYSRITRQLDISESEKRRYEDRLSSLTAYLQKFQTDTKERMESVVNRHKSCAIQIRNLEEQNSGLEQRLLKAIRERDACSQCLQVGRDKLAQLIGKSGAHELLGQLQSNDENGVIESRGSSHHHLAAPFFNTAEFLEYNLVSRRAEEIAACLAVSAKYCLRASQNEASSLRSQVFQLEEEKEMEVSTLKSRIRSLEREVLQQTTMMPETEYRRESYENTGFR